MKKFFGLLILLSLLVSCKKEEPVTPETPTNTFAFGTSLKSVTIPSVSGSSVSGTIDWGDGSSAEWSQKATKKYSDGTNHIVTIGVKNATSVTFGNLTGVTSLDLSQF